MTDAAALLAAERAIVRRGVAEAREIPGGWLLRHPPLGDVWHLNRVHLTGAADTLRGGELAALADRRLEGCPHRRVTLDDATAAEVLFGELEADGWRRERSIAMVLGDDVRAAADDPRVSRAGEATLAAFQRQVFADDAPITAIPAELPARLARAQSVLRAGSQTCAFTAAAARDSPPAAAATLYLDPEVAGRRVALIDQVATLRPYREQGLATAVVGAAIRAAGEWGADTVGLFADADDWPQIMYAGMGFVPVARQSVVHRDV